MRTTDEIVAEVCAALNVERVEIRRPERIVECIDCGSQFVNGACSACLTCAACGQNMDVRHDACADAAPTQQIVRTAGFEYFGNDRLDVSPRSVDPIGGWFAPSKELVSAAQAAWNQSRSLGYAFMQDFANGYTAEMRVRYGIVPGSDAWTTLSDVDQRRVYKALSRGVEPTPTAWDALLAMREVTLVCACEELAKCHRRLLAEILKKLGAKYAGEVR